MSVRRHAQHTRAASVDGGPAGSVARQSPGSALGAAERERVVEMQRVRLLNAMTHVAADRGAANVTVGDVVGRAGVSRRTFYELFADGEACLLEAFDQGIENAREALLRAWEPDAPWSRRVRGGLVALLCFFDEQPVTARLLIVESLAGGPRALERRTRALGPLLAAVDAGRDEARSSSTVPRLAAESAVGGALAVLHGRICTRPGEGLSDLASELTSMLVLPYQGSGAARRELTRPAPPPPAEGSRAPLRSDPFKDAGMRLTYRTMRVLGAIEAHPGSSNRHLGDIAGVGDQGQISKLLGRLQRLGLIENTSAGHVRGDANAWELTRNGRQVTQGIRGQTGTCSAGGRHFDDDAQPITTTMSGHAPTADDTVRTTRGANR